MEINDQMLQQIFSMPIFKGKIVSGSMEPVIKIGEEILVVVKAKDIKKFDIIVFKQNNKLICHYLWSINKMIDPKLMQTRSLLGGKDFPIREEDYIGKVVSHKLSVWRILKIIFF